MVFFSTLLSVSLENKMNVFNIECSRLRLFECATIGVDSKFEWKSASQCDSLLLPLLDKIFNGPFKRDSQQGTMMTADKQRAYNMFYCPHELKTWLSWPVTGNDLMYKFTARTMCEDCKASAKPIASEPKKPSKRNLYNRKKKKEKLAKKKQT